MEQRSRVLQTVNQVKALDAPRRSAPLVGLGVEDERRTVELFDQPAGREPEDTERPMAGAHHDHRRGVIELYHLGSCLADDLRSQLLTLGILLL